LSLLIYLIICTGQLESTMTLSYLKAGRLKQWLGQPDSPAFLRECKALFDKVFGERSDNLPAASAFGPVPDHLKPVIRGTQIALRATHIVNGVIYSRSSTHIGNSLIVFYPGGNRSSCAVPGSIQHIMFYSNNVVVFVVQRQVSAPPSQLDPYADYPHFPAQIYSNSLSPKLEIVRPDWVVSHYARWAIVTYRNTGATSARSTSLPHAPARTIPPSLALASAEDCASH